MALFLAPCAGLGQAGNFKVGPVVFDLTGSAGAVWSSNVSASSTGPKSDTYLAAGLDLSGSWPVSKFNNLEFGIGAEYRKYLRYSQLDSANNFVTLSPDTQVDFTVYAGAFTITVSDQLTFSSDATDAAVIDQDTNTVRFDILNYSRFENELTLKALWQLNALHNVSVSLVRTDVWALDDQFSSLERTAHVLTASLERIFSPSVTGGFYVSRSWNDYWSDFQNDSGGRSLGVHATWQITQFITATGRAGLTWTDFGTSGQNPDQSDISGMDYSVDLAHSLNSIYSHRLTFSRTYDYGFTSNYTRADNISYAFTYKGWNRADILGRLGWQHGVDSGGPAPEDYNRWFFHIGLGYSLSSRLTWELAYDYSCKDSNLSRRDYDRHEVSVFLRYDF